MIRSAILSECKTYRYELRRDWNPQIPRLVFIMLNPSTADSTKDDPTVRKCIGFAGRWGYGGFTIVNLFAFRATDPVDLLVAQKRKVNVVGPENNRFIEQAVGEVDTVVAAWGAIGGPTLRALEVARTLPRTSQAIQLTAKGYPCHPLMLAYDSPLQLWTHPCEAQE